MLFLNPLEKIFKHSSNKTHKVSSRKHPYFPYREFPGGGGGGREGGSVHCKTKQCKGNVGILIEISRGWGVLKKISSMGEVWAFSHNTTAAHPLSPMLTNGQ